MPKPENLSETEAATAGGWTAPEQVGSGGGGAQTRSSKRKRPNKVTPKYGERVTKYYHVASAELWGLFGVSALAAISFSIAVDLFTLSFDIYKDLELSRNLSKTLVNEWRGYETHCFYYGLIALFVSFVFLLIGGFKISYIKRTTHFNE